MNDLVAKIQLESRMNTPLDWAINGVIAKLVRWEKRILPYILQHPGCDSVMLGDHFDVGQSHINFYMRQLLNKGFLDRQRVRSTNGLSYSYTVNKMVTS